MLDRIGREVKRGDYVVVAVRNGNTADMDFGFMFKIDETKRRFKILRNGQESSWFNWYYHDVPKTAYCKVLKVSEILCGDQAVHPEIGAMYCYLGKGHKEKHDYS